jgi:hypothetical protein
VRAVQPPRRIGSPATERRGFGLLRVRSPLLTESRSISVPRGTEMFQFPRCPPPSRAVPAYDRGGVAPFGNPRISACWRLPGAFRRLPRPSSAPSAKASTVCPYPLSSCPISFNMRNGRRPSVGKTEVFYVFGCKCARPGRPPRGAPARRWSRRSRRPAPSRRAQRKILAGHWDGVKSLRRAARRGRGGRRMRPE